MDSTQSEEDRALSPREEQDQEELFLTEEINIEEMAIDGICGVY